MIAVLAISPLTDVRSAARGQKVQSRGPNQDKWRPRARVIQLDDH